MSKKEDLERIRRLRAGELQRLFRHRWGYVLPDDQSGREDLWLLMLNASLATAEPDKKMNHVIDLWAPWMGDEEREGYVRLLGGLDVYQRIQTGREIGNLLRLTNAERMKLKLWQFKPIDATDDELEAQRKARRSEDRRAKMRAKGVRSREAYLTELRSKPKPWEAEGVSQRTWQRRRVSRGSVPTIVSKTVQYLATRSGGESERGCRESGGVEKPRNVMKLRVVERRAPSSSSDLEHDLATTTDVVPHLVPTVRDDLLEPKATGISASTTKTSR